MEYLFYPFEEEYLKIKFSILKKLFKKFETTGLPVNFILLRKYFQALTLIRNYIYLIRLFNNPEAETNTEEFRIQEEIRKTIGILQMDYIDPRTVTLAELTSKPNFQLAQNLLIEYFFSNNDIVDPKLFRKVLESLKTVIDSSDIGYVIDVLIVYIRNEQ